MKAILQTYTGDGIEEAIVELAADYDFSLSADTAYNAARRPPLKDNQELVPIFPQCPLAAGEAVGSVENRIALLLDLPNLTDAERRMLRLTRRQVSLSHILSGMLNDYLKDKVSLDVVQSYAGRLTDYHILSTIRSGYGEGTMRAILSACMAVFGGSRVQSEAQQRAFADTLRRSIDEQHERLESELKKSLAIKEDE